MNYKTVSNLRDSVSAILQGLNLNNVKDVPGAFERTARQLAQKISIPDAMGQYSFPLYDGVVNYLSPSDIFGTSVLDLRQQGDNRDLNDYVYKKGLSDFDRQKNYLSNGSTVSFEFKKGVPVIKIVSTHPLPKIELDPMTDTTGWVAGGSASGITLDSTVKYHSGGSLRFLLTGASTGTLTKTIPRQDLTSYVGVGVAFLAIYVPSSQTIANLSSLTLKIGTSASAYYTVTATSGLLGAFSVGDWLLVAFDLATATTVGSPTVNNIVYTQVSITTVDTITNFYVGDLWISLPSPNTLIYKTAAIFQHPGANPISTIVDNSDYIILNDNAYAIYEQECAMTIASQQGGSLASGIVQQITQILGGIKQKSKGGGVITVQPGLYDLYRAENPSETINVISNWYE